MAQFVSIFIIIKLLIGNLFIFYPNFCSSAHWDNSFQIHNGYGDPVRFVFDHKKSVTALAYNETLGILATGNSCSFFLKST